MAAKNKHFLLRFYNRKVTLDFGFYVLILILAQGYYCGLYRGFWTKHSAARDIYLRLDANEDQIKCLDTFRLLIGLNGNPISGLRVFRSNPTRCKLILIMRNEMLLFKFELNYVIFAGFTLSDAPLNQIGHSFASHATRA